jgi:hypothetical protein
MAKSWKPSTPPPPPDTITGCARRYHACAQALATTLGVSLADVLEHYHTAVASIFIETSKLNLRLPSGVPLPPLAQANGQPDVSHTRTGHTNTGEPEAGEIMCSGMPPAPEVSTNGDPPPRTMADLPTRIPAGLQLPCAEALIADLRPAQLALLCGKVGLRALADKTLEPLHVALLAERARRFEGGKKSTPEANGHGA